jgi:antitoxin (DNA-binding transcriptional repressor) of toxin-antitoxin stability system
MAKTVNIHEAKTHLSRIVEEVAAGAEVAMARLVPLRQGVTRKNLGLLKGKLKIPPNFNAPLPEAVLRLFKGD